MPASTISWACRLARLIAAIQMLCAQTVNPQSGEPMVQALYSALLVFHLLPRGFSNRELRNHWAPLLGKKPQSITPEQMTYHLRRLRLHDIIARMPKSHRYRITTEGWRTILFCTRAYN